MTVHPIGEAVGANPPLIHPGPVNSQRRNVVASRSEAFDIDINVGNNIEDAVAAGFKKAGFSSGCVFIENLECAPLRYVIPAEPNDASRLAWYSDTHAPEGTCLIVQGYMSVGRESDDFFTHCHGVWQLANGDTALGHLLAGDTIAARSGKMQAIGFRNALFDRRDDAETGFVLFAAVSADTSPAQCRPESIAITLRPNQDISIAIEEICAEHNIKSAQIHGLGSLNGAEFANSETMKQFVTEFLVRSGRYNAKSGTHIDISAVDINAKIFGGVVKRGKATVSITSEFVIVPEPNKEFIK